MAEPSTLKLVLDKGPRKGETLEFRPGSVVRLGRVVRGNSVTIKDAGISSKHLTITFDKASGTWLITDLDSSNGTILNDTKLAANTPSRLSDGDTVKLGELTSIIVKIGGDFSAVRRSRRQAAPASGVIVKEEEVVGERSELGLGLESSFGGNAAEKPKEKEKNEVEIVKEIRNDAAETKKTRGRPPKGKCEVEIVKEIGDNVVVEKKITRGRAKKGANSGSQVEERLYEDKNEKEIGNVGASVEVNQGRQLRSRSTRNSKKEEAMQELSEPLESLSDIERKVRKGRGKKKVIEDEASKNVEKENVEVREVAENLVTNLPEVVQDQDGNESIVNRSNEELRVEDVLETKDVEEKEEGSGVKDDHVDLGMEPDLEKMTLGEWFDFLEVYLPKQIHDETEELISNMKQRAKQFHDYKLEQERAREKGKAPMT